MKMKNKIKVVEHYGEVFWEIKLISRVASSNAPKFSCFVFTLITVYFDVKKKMDLIRGCFKFCCCRIFDF